MNKKIKYTSAESLLTVFIITIGIVAAYPLYYVLVASFSDPYQVYAGKTFLKPSGFTLRGYQSVFLDPNLLSGFFNSVKYTFFGTLYSVALLYLTAYPLSFKNLPGRKLISIFFIITLYFSGGLIPTYLIVKETGLINTTAAIIIPGGIAVSNMVILRSFFENNIPRDIMEAAKIDGAGYWRIFVQVVIPLSKPIMAVMIVYSMVAYWNDWFTALIYLPGQAKAPLPLVLRNILIKSSVSAAQSSTISGGYAELNKITEMIKFSSMIVAAFPMLVIFPFVQKYFEKGLMAGAVKG
ncbi:MAG: carbohydrate ABC transporter permease [Treponema sp.]|nr:carbohydrate ABC transporter permease [Treponema sp.]